jgi:hypothetical protein
MSPKKSGVVRIICLSPYRKIGQKHTAGWPLIGQSFEIFLLMSWALLGPVGSFLGPFWVLFGSLSKRPPSGPQILAPRQLCHVCDGCMGAQGTRHEAAMRGMQESHGHGSISQSHSALDKQKQMDGASQWLSCRSKIGPRVLMSTRPLLPDYRTGMTYQLSAKPGGRFAPCCL